jgi:hypothetical protein
MNRTGVEKILFPVKLIPFNKKIPFLFIQQKILSNDWTRLGVKEIYHSISFIILISFNFVQSHSKTKEQTHEIQLNSAKIQVLM